MRVLWRSNARVDASAAAVRGSRSGLHAGARDEGNSDGRPGDQAGWLAHIDTRAKILVSLLASLMTVIISVPAAQAVMFACSLVYALGMRRPRLLVLAYLICTAMFGLAAGFAALIASLGPMPPVSAASLAVPFLRLAVMINVVLPLALATPVQSMLTALKSIRLPFFLYIPLAVMVRYIPTFFADFKQISEALQIRGYRLSFRKFLLHPVLSMRFVTTPLIFRSLKTSEDLGVAAELKGLGAERKVTPYRTLVWKRNDTLLVLAALLVVAASAACALLLPEDLPLGAARGGMR